MNYPDGSEMPCFFSIFLNLKTNRSVCNAVKTKKAPDGSNVYNV